MHIKIWTGVSMCTYECTHPYILVEAVTDISWCKYMFFLCQSTWASSHLTIWPCGHLAFRSGHVTAWPCAHVAISWPDHVQHVINRLPGLLIIWLSDHLTIRPSNLLSIWASMHLSIWAPMQVSIWPYGHLTIWLSENLLIPLLGHLMVWLLQAHVKMHMSIYTGVPMCTMNFTHSYISTEWATDSPWFVYMFCSIPGPVLKQHQGHIVHCNAMLSCHVLTHHFHSKIDSWIPISKVYTFST